MFSMFFAPAKAPKADNVFEYESKKDVTLERTQRWQKSSSPESVTTPKLTELSTSPGTSVDIRRTPLGILQQNCQTFLELSTVKGPKSCRLIFAAVLSATPISPPDSIAFATHFSHRLHCHEVIKRPFRFASGR